MSNSGSGWSMGRILTVSVIIGIIALLLFWLALSFKFGGALLWGIIVGVITFLILWLNFGGEEDGSSAGSGMSSGSTSSGSGAASTGTSSDSGAGATSAAASASSASVATSGATAAGSMAAEKPAETSAAAKPKPAAAKAKPKAKPAAASKPKAASAGTKAKAASGGTKATKAADGSPELYKKAPKDADDLKMIKGVGPGLEKTLNEMGIYKFDQVASWKKKDIAWVDDRLKFKGRIERDDWVKQAKTLAKGGTTEFSKRAKY